MQCPFPPPTKALSAGLSTGYYTGRDASAGVVFRFRTTSICPPLGSQTTLGMFQLAHARSSLCRSLLPIISLLSLGRITYSMLCHSVNSRSVWSTCCSPTARSPPSTNRRSVQHHLRPRCILACILCSLGLVTPCLPGGQPLYFC